MNTSNYEDITDLAESEEERYKVSLILDSVFPDENQSVPDPYYDEMDGFNQVFEMLKNSCSVIAKELEKS